MIENLTNLLSGKVIVVIGGAGTIGRKFVEAIIENQGIAIIGDTRLIDTTEINLHSVESEIVDFNSKDSLCAVIEKVVSKYGKIDAVVNSVNTPSSGFFEDTTYEEFCNNISLHQGGYFLSTQQFSLFFKKQGFGNVINIASIQGITSPKFDTYKGVLINGNPMTSDIDYTCSKHAIIAMTKYLAKYFKNYNIRFNCISPGGILDKQPEEFIERYNAYCINKGMLNAEDLKGALVFLLADMSKFVNGQNIVVDDGWSL